ncbi:uncharacterized protein RJT21DRAFT_3399 [Scheffersomyces amazonensis]|uniref:uncharacterized protein n=1 Tax=Scheffersomyces amazonensis TaxID=1078765 RepID=UPI00315DBBB3
MSEAENTIATEENSHIIISNSKSNNEGNDHQHNQEMIDEILELKTKIASIVGNIKDTKSVCNKYENEIQYLQEYISTLMKIESSKMSEPASTIARDMIAEYGIHKTNDENEFIGDHTITSLPSHPAAAKLRTNNGIGIGLLQRVNVGSFDNLVRTHVSDADNHYGLIQETSVIECSQLPVGLNKRADRKASNQSSMTEDLFYEASPVLDGSTSPLVPTKSGIKFYPTLIERYPTTIEINHAPQMTEALPEFCNLSLSSLKKRYPNNHIYYCSPLREERYTSDELDELKLISILSEEIRHLDEDKSGNRSMLTRLYNSLHSLFFYKTIDVNSAWNIPDHDITSSDSCDDNESTYELEDTRLLLYS